MTLNSLLHIPKTDLKANVITGSFATVVLSYFKEKKVEVISITPDPSKQFDTLVVIYNGKRKKLKINRGISAYKIGKRIGCESK